MRIVLLLGAIMSFASPPPMSVRADQSGIASVDDKPGEVRVIVRGFRNKKGQALISLFDSAKGFPDRGDLARDRVESTIDSDTVEIIFPQIPPGIYAVAVLHDEDGDYEMDTGAFGIPKEGYGVSRNARGRFGPPKYKDAKFEVPPGTQMTVRIKLIYH